MNEIELKDNQEVINEGKNEIYLLLKTILILGLSSIILVLIFSMF